MQKVSRKIFMDIFWLTLSLVLTILLSILLFGHTFLTGDLDLHLHDTYFVISRWLILIPLFLMLTFGIYFFKRIWLKLNTTFANWVIVVTGLTLIISLTLLIKTFSQFSVSGWTLYPPLSSLGPDKVSELKPVPQMTIIANFLTLIQFIISAMLVFAVYRWGKQKRDGSE